MFSPALDCENAEGAIAKDQRRSAARHETGTSDSRIVIQAIIDNDRLPRRECLTDWIAFKRNDSTGRALPVIVGKIKCGDTQFIARLVVKRQRRGFVRHDRTQSRRDRGEQLSQIQVGDERVVDLQQQLRAIAVARYLLSLELCFDGNDNLAGDELREIDIELAIGADLLAPQIQYAEFLMNGAQRDTAD